MQNVSRLGSGSTSAPTAATIAQRLSTLSSDLTQSCQRIESVLGRVNGTPQQEGAAQPAVTATAPMMSSVEVIEAQAERLNRLVNLLEQVA